jgi:uncharacterized protein YaiI (UPF0178 family)
VILWIDADSCPVPIREVIGRACQRTGLTGIFVADREIPLPEGDLLEMVVISKGDDAADNYILKHVSSGDLVVTRDIPFAAELVEKNVHVINDRGDEFTPDNIRTRLSERNIMYEMRFNYIMEMNRKKQFGKKEVHAFSAAFDRILRKLTGTS